MKKPQIFALTTLLALTCSTFAAPQLRLSDGTTTITIADGSANDQSPEPGVVTYVGPIGPKWNVVNVTVGITKPDSGDAANPYMDLNTFNQSSGAGDLYLAYTDTDFTPPSGTWDAEAGGTSDGTVELQYFLDSSNTPFGTNMLLADFAGLTDVYSPSNAGPFAITAPYSMTLVGIFHHTGRGSSAFDSQLFLTPPQQQPPTIQCAGDRDLGCNPEVIPSCDTNSITVNASCGVSNITCSVGGPDIVTGCVHERDLVYTVSDNCGQSASCTQHIYWTQDNTPPSFTVCPSDMELGCNPTNVPDCDLSKASATDDCGRVVISCGSVDSADGCSHVRTITYTATDSCGNSATCVQHVRWTADTTAPQFVNCATNRDLGCNPTTVPDCDTNSVTVTDDCSTPTVTCSSSDSATGCAHSRTITYIATDACGNTASCVQNITWTVDKTKPVFTTCAADRDLGCNPSTIPDCDTNTVAATDTCSTPSITCSSSDSVSGCAHTRTITYVATDACGNSASCVQHITWTVDNTAPQFTVCPTRGDLGCNPRTIPDCNLNSASATDNCGTPTVTCSKVDSSSGCGHTRTITYIATDACGNSASCVQVLTWTVDTTAPVFTKNPSNMNLNCNPSSIPAVNLNSTNVAATDACSTPTITGSYVDTTNSCSRTRTITYVATDACGNSSSKQQVITWTVDTTVPTLTVSDITVNICSIAQTCTTVTYNGTASDTCSGTSIAYNPPAGTCFPIGTNIVTATAYNACGMSTNKTFKVIVTRNLGGCYITYTPGGWFAPPNGGNAGQLLKDNFTKIYGSTGVIVGGTKTIKFTTSSAVDAFPTGGGSPSYLTKSYINPTASTEAGEFAAQVIALKFNCDFSTKGIFKVGLTTLKVAPGYPLAGQTVANVLVICNKALGGGGTPAGVSISDLTKLLSGINGNYDGGLTDNGVLVL